MRKIVFGILCVGLWAVSATTAKAAGTTTATEPETIQATAQPTYQQGAFYVRIKKGNAPKLNSGERKVSVNRLAPLASLREAYSVHETMQSMRVFDNAELARTFLVEFDDIEKSEELLARLAAMPEVEMVERVPAYFITASMPEAPAPEAEEPADEPTEGDDTKPNDPFYGIKNGANFSWHLDLIHAEEAWKMQQSDSNIVVAVVDNAIWGDHPDLQIPASRQYNVRDGKVGNSAPPSSVSQSTQCSNYNACDVYMWSHGTHCAGAIGAIKNNGVGIASMGSGVNVMGVSCPSTVAGGVQNAFAGIVYAAENGARVISTSWGSYSISNTERAIVQACIDKGIVMVSAAGNDRINTPFYPANLPGVISIGSVNSDKTVSSFSNYGEWVMLAAPGGFVSTNGTESNFCIFSTTYCQSQRYRLQGVNGVTGEYYDGMFGTSMATPVTSGLCGFLLSADSTLTPYLLREILMASAQDIVVGNTPKPIQPGSGIIDATAALELIKNRKPMPRNLTADREELSRTVRLAWQAPEEGKVKNYRIYVNGTVKAEVEDTAWSEEVAPTANLYHYGVAAVFEDGSVSLRDCRDVYVPDLGEVTITIRPEGSGSVSMESGYYPQKDTLHLVAVPAEGYTFTRWMDNGKRIGTDSILDYEVAFSSTVLEAVFSKKVDVEKAAPAGSLKIYPNPTSGTLFVESSDDIYRMEVYSLGGIRLWERDLASAGALQVELNVSRFAEGMYLLKVFGKNGVTIEKFLIKK